MNYRAQDAAFRLSTTLPVRTITARPVDKPASMPLAQRRLMERDAKIRRLYAQGWTMERIGSAVGLTKSTVWKRLKGKK